MGSKSDMETMEKAGKVLEEAGVRHEIRVMSAHRDPDVVADYCKNARMRGLRVIIAGAGLSAALPGVAAAHTDLPVIGVPLTSRLTAAGGLDAILSIVQMPPGVPVAARRPGQPAQRRAPGAAHPAGVSIRTLSSRVVYENPWFGSGRTRSSGRRLARRLRRRREERLRGGRRRGTASASRSSASTSTRSAASPGSSRRARSTTASADPEERRAHRARRGDGAARGPARATSAGSRSRRRSAQGFDAWLATDLRAGRAAARGDGGRHDDARGHAGRVRRDGARGRDRPTRRRSRRGRCVRLDGRAVTSLRGDLAARRPLRRPGRGAARPRLRVGLIRARVQVEVEWLLVARAGRRRRAAARVDERLRRRRRAGDQGDRGAHEPRRQGGRVLAARARARRAARAPALRPDERGRQQPLVRAHAPRRGRATSGARRPRSSSTAWPRSRGRRTTRRCCRARTASRRRRRRSARRWRSSSSAGGASSTQLGRQEYRGKLNGAVGTYGALAVADPDARLGGGLARFVEALGLTWSPLTTQIEPHDWIAELFHLLARFNAILVDFDRDLWAYISRGLVRQRVVAGEVGSSTMPHKVNPIDFENSEANAGVSTALGDAHGLDAPGLAPAARLSDSSLLRNSGVVIGHSLLALRSALKGLGQDRGRPAAMLGELADAWEVLAEAVQTVMRKRGGEDPYEQLKGLTRGARIDRDSLRAFVEGLDLDEADRARLLALTPAQYTGLAAALVGAHRDGPR